MQIAFSDFLETVSSAIAIAWNNKKQLAKYVAIPILGLFVLNITEYHANYESDIIMLILFIAYIVVYVMFAVKIHQIALLPKEEIDKNLLKAWDRRNNRFLVYAVILIAILFFLILTLGMSLSFLIRDESGFYVGYGLAFVLGAYIFSRSSLVFPACAVGHKVSIMDSWRISRNARLYMFLVIVMPPIITSLFFLPFREWESGLAYSIHCLIIILAYIFEIMCLSVAYRIITKQLTQ